MKRTTIALGLAGALVLGPAALASAGERHGGGQSNGCVCTPRHHHPSGHHHEGHDGHHGHGKPPAHHPRPHPAPKPHKPVCKPVKHHHPKPPRPPHHHRPPHHTPPPIVHHPHPVVTPPHHVATPVTHRTSTVKRVTPTAHLTALPRTGPADVLAIGGAALAFLCIGGGLVLLTRPERRFNKAAKR